MEQQLKQVDEMFTQWKGSEYEQCISGWVKSIYQDSHEGIIKSVDSKNIRGKLLQSSRHCISKAKEILYM